MDEDMILLPGDLCDRLQLEKNSTELVERSEHVSEDTVLGLPYEWGVWGYREGKMSRKVRHLKVSKQMTQLKRTRRNRTRPRSGDLFWWKEELEGGKMMGEPCWRKLNNTSKRKTSAFQKNCCWSSMDMVWTKIIPTLRNWPILCHIRYLNVFHHWQRDNLKLGGSANGILGR
uniref:Uncharacterized protein n=1 Tax=Arundo donax TaxID=35708 RepID=A0A0A8YD77_ARUDO